MHVRAKQGLTNLIFRLQSWFIGKVAPEGKVPPTPSTTAPPHPHSSALHDDPMGQAQVSPMSSAFPAVNTRATPVI